MPLPVCSRLVLYTDGLVERRQESLDAGLARLADASHAARRLPLEALQREIVQSSFADYEQQDDVAMICAELVSQSTTRFTRSIEPDPGELAPTRRSLTYWLRAGGAAPERSRDIVLAIGEALANAVEHGHNGRARVELDVRREGDQITATVQDRGSWADQVVDDTRGRGLRIMEALADRVEVDRGDHGTKVSLLLPSGSRDVR
jgi:anti-sigma regulatory factor (Ser/Thr protein kinase)